MGNGHVGTCEKAFEKLQLLGSRQALVENFTEWLLAYATQDELADFVWQVFRHHPGVDETIDERKVLDRNSDLDDDFE